MDVAELVITRDEDCLLHLRIDRAEICIGSNPTNDVVVPDQSVPEVAALLIDRGARRYQLRDLTLGAIKLNNAPLEEDEVPLDNGDVITIGTYSLKLQVRTGEAVSRQHFGRTNVLGLETRTEQKGILTYRSQRLEVDPARPFNIGCHEDNELVIDDGYVSSFHCRVTSQAGRWYLVDLDSTNGTEVNGLRVLESELPIPASIKVGKERLSFEVSTTAQAKAVQTEEEPFRGMIGESKPMRHVFELIRRFRDAQESVLIIGESGCGKELVARALHDESSHADGPFLALNCAALASTIIESELFGHVKGAFTGAVSDKPGAFEATSEGTLFLDEIGELPLELQPKLLRALETGTVRRVGGTKEIPVSTRIVAATHRNLEELVSQSLFREDLFHRLFVLSIRIPPLSDRSEDIIPLAEHFIRESPRQLKLADDARDSLLDYTWPGNIRELRNTIVRAILMTDEQELHASDLQFSRDAFTSRAKDARRSVRRYDETERKKILEALEKAGGNRAEAARMLGVSKSTFHDRIKRYGIPLKFGPRK